MYWCEGDKSEESRTYRVALTSSDVAMLKLFIRWLEHYYGVKRSRVKLRLHLWPNVNEQHAKEFWSTNLGVSIKNFTKSWIKPKGKGKRIHPYGICRASISSKELLHKILSDINNEFKLPNTSV
jgi:hypothetical protein